METTEHIEIAGRGEDSGAGRAAADESGENSSSKPGKRVEGELTESRTETVS